MRPRISRRGFVHPSVHRSVGRLDGLSVRWSGLLRILDDGGRRKRAEESEKKKKERKSLVFLCKNLVYKNMRLRLAQNLRTLYFIYCIYLYLFSQAEPKKHGSYKKQKVYKIPAGYSTSMRFCFSLYGFVHSLALSGMQQPIKSK